MTRWEGHSSEHVLDESDLRNWEMGSLLSLHNVQYGKCSDEEKKTGAAG